MESGDAVREFDGGRVAMAGVLPVAVGLVATMTGSVPGPGVREIGGFTLFALVFALAEIAVQTGPRAIRDRPNLFRIAVGVCLFVSLAAAGAIGP